MAFKRDIDLLVSTPLLIFPLLPPVVLLPIIETC